MTTVDELRIICKQQRILNCDEMEKPELITLIRHAFINASDTYIKSLTFNQQKIIRLSTITTQNHINKTLLILLKYFCTALLK